MQLVDSIVDSDLWLDVDKKLDLLRAAVLLQVGPVVKSCADLLEQADISFANTSFAFAQASQPILVENLLNAKEIKAIRRESAAMTHLSGGQRNKHTGNWRTNYLHTNDHFCKQHPEITAKLFDALRRVDRESNWGLAEECNLTMRCVEHHIVKRSGSLPDPTHYDRGSVLTMDIMLSDPSKDFEGGEFCTLEKDQMLKHSFKASGNALVFISHKYHSIRPILKGKREVLLIEFWKGEKRSCPHRCEQFQGPCRKYQVEGAPRGSKRLKKSSGPSTESDSHYDFEGSASSVVLEHVADVAPSIFEAYAFAGRAIFPQITDIQTQSKGTEAASNVEISFESCSPEATVRALDKISVGKKLIFK